MEKEVEVQTRNEHKISGTKRPSRVLAGITYVDLGKCVFAFALGAAFVLIFQNQMQLENITFSTIGLVSFLFSIALAGASIILAITAIQLGTASERAMTERSDESIRLQNEVFIRTTDALQRIASSTGVTEKRIEDIISGRAGDISQSVLEKALYTSPTGKSREVLEQNIKEAVLDVFRESGKGPIKSEEQKLRNEANMRYRIFHNNLLIGIANDPHVKSEKIGDGSYYGEGEGLLDGVFMADSIKFGIAALSSDKALGDRFLGDYEGYIQNLLKEIGVGTCERVFLVFEETLPEESEYKKGFASITSIYSEKIASKLFIFSGPVDEIVESILENIGIKSST